MTAKISSLFLFLRFQTTSGILSILSLECLKRYAAVITAMTLPAVSASAATDAGIPGLEFLQLPANADIGEVFARLYVWGIGFVALAAFLMLTWGGVLYMIAGDRDPSDAKNKMRNAIYGLLLALGSYLILYTINPALVNINKLELPEIKQAVPTTDEPPATPNGFCARKGIILCAKTTSTSCPGGWFYPTFSDDAFRQCEACTQKLNEGQPLSSCTQ